MVPQKRQVHQHADRDEEQRDEDVAEREQLRERLVAVVRFGQHEPSEKRAQRQRRAGGGGGERRQRHQQDDRDEKQLPAAGFENLPQQPRHQEAGGDDHADDDQRRLAERHRHPHRAPFRRPREKGHEQHDRHDTEVLEDQDSRRQAPVWRVDLAAVGQQLQDDRGAREGDEEPQEHGHLPARDQHQAQQRGRGRGEPHLENPHAHDLPRHLAEAGQGELDPDGEQQQDDADLGEGLDGVHVPHQPQRVGAEQQPRDNEAGEGREAEPVEHQDHQHRNREDDGEILQQVDLHGRASRRKWIERCYLVW